KTGGRVPFSVVSNPEFLREGSAIEDFMKPDRVVIGAREARAVEIMKEVYSPLETIEVPFVVTNVETSELIKYASNAFLATKITFINEVAALCERLGADVIQVARGMGLDQRIGPQFLHPGPGMEELRPDALVEPHAARHLDDVGAQPLAQRGDLVDESDLGREEGVRRVLDELGG